MNQPGGDILKMVARTMADHNMTAAGDSILVTVSGGVDSVTLLWCLVQLAASLSVARIGVVHFNHCLRGQAADDDLAFVRRLAGSYGLPCYAETVDVAEAADKQGLSLEDAARRLRYDFFERTADAYGYDKIATAHHADDNAEQVLMALLRGSGTTGLSGIPPVRQGRIIRPFINLSRAEIEAATAREHLEFTFDATNKNLNFVRNRVRQQLIPFLRREFNANIADNLNNLADILRQEEVWLEPLVSEIFSKVLLAQQNDEIVLAVPAIREQPRAVQRRLVRKALATIKGDLRRITMAQTDTIIQCLYKEQTVTLDMPGGVVVAKSGGRLTFCLAPVWQKAVAATGCGFFHTLLAEGAANASLAIPEIGARIDFSVIAREDIKDVTAVGGGRIAFFDLERLSFPLTVRNVLPGDRFVPLGMKGHQKVKDFFINRKVPRHQRRACPVVFSGDRIVWLAGFRVADPVKITATTTRVLKAELIGSN